MSSPELPNDKGECCRDVAGMEYYPPFTAVSINQVAFLRKWPIVTSIFFKINGGIYYKQSIFFEFCSNGKMKRHIHILLSMLFEDFS